MRINFCSTCLALTIFVVMLANLVLIVTLPPLLPKYLTHVGYYPSFLGRVPFIKAAMYCPCLMRWYSDMNGKYEVDFPASEKLKRTLDMTDELEFDKPYFKYPYVGFLYLEDFYNSTSKYVALCYLRDEGEWYVGVYGQWICPRDDWRMPNYRYIDWRPWYIVGDYFKLYIRPDNGQEEFYPRGKFFKYPNGSQIPGTWSVNYLKQYYGYRMFVIYYGSIKDPLYGSARKFYVGYDNIHRNMAILMLGFRPAETERMQEHLKKDKHLTVRLKYQSTTIHSVDKYRVHYRVVNHTYSDDDRNNEIYKKVNLHEDRIFYTDTFSAVDACNTFPVKGCSTHHNLTHEYIPNYINYDRPIEDYNYTGIERSFKFHLLLTTCIRTGKLFAVGTIDVTAPVTSLGYYAKDENGELFLEKDCKTLYLHNCEEEALCKNNKDMP